MVTHPASSLAQDRESSPAETSVLTTTLRRHRLLAGIIKTTDQIFMKFYGMVGHNPETSRLDFGGNPDLDPDPGIFQGILSIA